MKRKNKVKIMIAVLVSAFIALNITWFVYVQKTYAPYKEGLSKGPSFGSYYGLKEGCGISVTYPMYLSFKSPGNISLTYNSEKCGLSLHIWPSALIGEKEYTYGLEIYEHTEKDGKSGLSQSHSMYVDENGYPTERNAEDQGAYEKYKEAIEEIFKAYESLK